MDRPASPFEKDENSCVTQLGVIAGALALAAAGAAGYRLGTGSWPQLDGRDAPRIGGRRHDDRRATPRAGAQAALLPQPHGARRHLAGAQERRHGHGLHPRLRRRGQRRRHRGQDQPRPRAALRRAHRAGRASAASCAPCARPAWPSPTSAPCIRSRCAPTPSSRSSTWRRPAPTSKRASRCFASTARPW